MDVSEKNPAKIRYKMKQLQRPKIHIETYSIAMPFLQAKEVGSNARFLLALASNFRIHGSNLYRLCSNEAIEILLGLNHGQLMRSKKQLRDASLLNYDGTPGDYSGLIQRWENITDKKWEYDL